MDQQYTLLRLQARDFDSGSCSWWGVKQTRGVGCWTRKAGELGGPKRDNDRSWLMCDDNIRWLRKIGVPCTPICCQLLRL